MAIVYPLTLPSSPGFKRLVMRAQSTNAMTASPFTLQQQVQEHQGEAWGAEGTLPAMVRADAAAWVAFQLSLRGRKGTFVMGDPAGATPRGIATGTAPMVRGASQTGIDLDTRGWTASQTGILKAMDYYQIAKNYLASPTAFDDAIWQKNQCTVPVTSIVDPEGNAIADRAVPDGGATDAWLVQTPATLPGAIGGRVFVASLWIKGASVSIELSIRGNSAAIRGSTQMAVSGGWNYRTVSATMDAADTTISIRIGGSNTWPVADGNLDLWGASLTCISQDARLHQNLQDTDSDSSGFATFDIWPRLREAPPDFSRLITSSPVGLFRLASNVTEWDLDEVMNFGMGFSAREDT